MNTRLLLIAGISNAGKSSFADFLEKELGVTHVPLDKYFLSVPAGTDFLNWVQSPASIDWDLLEDHLGILANGSECYSPAFDPWGSGQRLTDGGDIDHPRSRLMKPGNGIYAVPGCLAFEYSGSSAVAAKIFVTTNLQTVASRHAGRNVPEAEINPVLNQRLTDRYPHILAYQDEADLVLSGEATDAMRLEYRDLLQTRLEL